MTLGALQGSESIDWGEQVIEMTRETYSGPLQAGEDLMRFEVGDTVEVIPFSP